MIWKIIGYAVAGILSFILFYGGWQIFKVIRLQRKIARQFNFMLKAMIPNSEGGEYELE